MSQNTSTITNLVEVQLKSFQGFLKNGLKSILYEKNVIISSDFELFLNFNKIKFGKPFHNIDFCLSNKRTFAIPVYLPIKIKLDNKIILNKYVFFGEMPLMTDKGCFVINGNFRVIVNQILRSPGIYYEKSNDNLESLLTIVPCRGSWLTLKKDL